MKILLSCLFLGLSMMAYANDDLNLNVNVNDPSFVVSLPANATTGFQWSVVRFDKSFLTLASSNYEKQKTNLIGSGGQMQFTFTLQKGKKYPENTEIVFKYARSWEPESATIKNVKVRFVS